MIQVEITPAQEAKMRALGFAVSEVEDYFLREAGYKPRSAGVLLAIRQRITKRLKEGFTVEDLKRCVDFALTDEFYLSKGYYKQADVIWRNRDRVESILARIQVLRERPIPL